MSDAIAAYAPQLGEALHITHTQLNVIGESLTAVSLLILIVIKVLLEIVRS